MARPVRDARFAFRLSNRALEFTGLAIAVVLGSARVACLVPARRAAPVDPIVALRQD